MKEQITLYLCQLHCMDWLCENKWHYQPYPIMQHNYHPCPCLILPPLTEEVRVPATASLMQTKSGHEPTQGSMLCPHGSTERAGYNATNASASSNENAIIHPVASCFSDLAILAHNTYKHTTLSSHEQTTTNSIWATDATVLWAVTISSPCQSLLH